MQIQGPGPLSGPERISGPRPDGPRGPRPDPVRSGEDRVELSDTARFLEKLKRLPDVRPGKVEEMRERTQEPDFDSDERLRVSLYRMIQDMDELGLDPLEDGGE